jgi:hypothetical protein
MHRTMELGLSRWKKPTTAGKRRTNLFYTSNVKHWLGYKGVMEYFVPRLTDADVMTGVQEDYSIMLATMSILPSVKTKLEIALATGSKHLTLTPLA